MDDPHDINYHMLYCANRGDVDGVRKWIEVGADVNHVWFGGRAMGQGWTALGVALSAGYHFFDYRRPSCDVIMVKELLDLGADPNNDHPRALNFYLNDAMRHGGDSAVDLVAALIARGADVNRNCSIFGTPLRFVHSSLCVRDPKMAVSVAQLLIAAGARIDEKFYDGATLLDCALQRMSYDPWISRALAKCLLRAGAPTTGLEVLRLEEVPNHRHLFAAKTFIDPVVKRGGWKEYARWHKQVLVGLVTKCQPMPDDAAGLVVDFYCPSGGS